MNIRKLLGIPTTEELAQVVTAAVIKELDNQVIGPLLERVDSQIAKAKNEVVNTVTDKVSKVEDRITQETRQIKNAVVESAEMIKGQATKKVEKKMDDSLKKLRSFFK
jgi:division protein CdvB (Snf7/Vps24/ESCRT-III family)